LGPAFSLPEDPNATAEALEDRVWSLARRHVV
jgi:hypothetical protein